MSPALSLTTARLPIFKSQDVSKESHTKLPARGNPIQRPPSEANLGRRELMKSTSSSLLAAALSSVLPARAEPESPQESTSNQMSYSRFLEYLNGGAGLPQELLRKLKEKEVDFAAHPMEPNVGLMVLDLLANWAFPLLLLGSLHVQASC